MRQAQESTFFGDFERVNSNAQPVESIQSSSLSDAQTSGDEVPAWDAFRLLAQKKESVRKGQWLSVSFQCLKLVALVTLFFLTLFSAAVAKATFLLILAGISSAGRNVTICNDKIHEAEHNTVFLPTHLAAKWAWTAVLALCVPELVCFARSVRQSFFRNVCRPSLLQFSTVFVVESLHAYGVGALTFDVLPYVPGYIAAMLANTICIVPAVLTAFGRQANRWLPLAASIDFIAIAAQCAVLWAWPSVAPELSERAWPTFVYATCASAAWWQNFVTEASPLRPLRAAAVFSTHISTTSAKTYTLLAPWKCLLYIYCLFSFVSQRILLDELIQHDLFGERMITIRADDLSQRQVAAFQERMRQYETSDYLSSSLPSKFGDMTNKNRVNTRFEEQLSSGRNGKASRKSHKSIKKGEKIVKSQKPYVARLRRDASLDYSSPSLTVHKFMELQSVELPEGEEPIRAFNVFSNHVELNQFTTPYDALSLAFLQICAVIVCYQSSKFACKVMLQRSGFALPITLASPLTVVFLASVCHRRQRNACALTSLLSKESFWVCDSAFGQLNSVNAGVWSSDFWLDPQTLIWLAWLASQFWITLHLWTQGEERLAHSEKLFVLFGYNGAFIDLSLALNRRRNDKHIINSKILNEDDDLSDEPSSRFKGVSEKHRINAGAVCKIYVCATMWHESAEEMAYMLKSIFRMDEDQCARRNAQKYLKVLDPDYYEFEAHMVLDDAFEITLGGETTTVNKYVRELIKCVDRAASSVHRTQIRLRRPKLCETPYGGRLSYIMPGKNRLTVYLKDRLKVRQRKRWSQVMYLYYLLGYRLRHKIADPVRRAAAERNTFVLTLDGDVDFAPECVTLLVDLMKKDRRLGAACGRIHPRGSGLMIWYQKFEYAVGHWLQKATEHMIGCVLCSPGCFSLFRAQALMDDNVTRRYATKSEKPIHYVQYDQGEDRWLCTLLLQRGYRVEYCAASDALTFAPEGFNEFFNQRRRWTPSTMANIIDLLRDYKNVIAVNESISIWYIFYQCIMLLSSVLGPGTIFLMIVGAISISFSIDTRVALVAVTLPVVCFCICCFTMSADKQLLLAQIFGALFAMLMTAVLVGTALQIQKDSIMSPHAIFLFTVLASFTIAAVLHPCEFVNILYIFLYFLAIPCMYMLLPIYSITNLNTVTWGTRENINDEIKKKLRGSQLVDYERDGEFSVGCGSACRLLCCVRPTPEQSIELSTVSQHIREMGHNLEQINSKLRSLNGAEQPIESPANIVDTQQVSDSQSNAIVGQTTISTWMNDKCFVSFEQERINADESVFWAQMIEKYLKPIQSDPAEQKQIRDGLASLRNTASSAFFMSNIVFIVIVLILQMQKDCLHIEWPFGPKFNHTLVPCNSEDGKEIWVLTRLQLEPIGLVFLVFFLSILLIQFVAMLMHRIGTLAHIIASTRLVCWPRSKYLPPWNYSLGRASATDVDDDKVETQNVVEIVRELQAIRGAGETSISLIADRDALTASANSPPSSHTQSAGQRQNVYSGTLDDAFRQRFFALSAAGRADVRPTPNVAKFTLPRVYMNRP